ncbi:MAG: carboxymuconolactone decarboxylase family protein [Solirubrobacterales bacterium]|nr:carboxymuconolactone decarboxylase family protein [Solirubrobacterales bacterium]
MTRIEGVDPKQAGPMVKLALRFGPRLVRKLAGRAPQLDDGLEPLRIQAYQPKLMLASARFGAAMQKPRSLDERVHLLAHLKGAQMVGCEYCVDLGSQISRKSGLSDDELLALVDYNNSPLFSAAEKAALDFTTGFMRTPVDISDEVFANAQRYFSNAELVELAALLAFVNGFRFNAAFEIGSAGFSEGMVCALPDKPAGSAARLKAAG